MTETEINRLPFCMPGHLDARADELERERNTQRRAIEDAQRALKQVALDEGQLSLSRARVFFEHFAEHNDIPLEQLLDAENSATYRRYQDFGRFPGLYASGSYWVETSQRTVSLHLHRNRSGEVEATAKSVRFLLPHMKPDAKGLIRMGIFDAGGSHWCAMFDSITHDDCFLTTRSRRFESEGMPRFDTVEALLAYVQNNHAYSDDTSTDD